MIKACLIAVFCLACKNTGPVVQKNNEVTDKKEIKSLEKELKDQEMIKDAPIPVKPNKQSLPQESPTLNPDIANNNFQEQNGEAENRSKEVGINSFDENIQKPEANTGSDYRSIEEIISTSENKVLELQKIDHNIFNEILSSHVKQGKVDYATIKSTGKLDKYLQILSSTTPSESWSRNEKLAYWINTYNAFTIKLIIENYPLKSITDLHGGKPWDVKWIKLGNNSYSLNEIENDIIRPEFREPRIHFAVNCAAISCPPLASKAYTAENLEELLEAQTRSFINNNTFNQLDKKKVAISKIFEWYAQDFSDLVAFLNKYSSFKIDKSARIVFNEYNWSLNKK